MFLFAFKTCAVNLDSSKADSRLTQPTASGAGVMWKSIFSCPRPPRRHGKSSCKQTGRGKQCAHPPAEEKGLQKTAEHPGLEITNSDFPNRVILFEAYTEKGSSQRQINSSAKTA